MLLFEITDDSVLVVEQSLRLMWLLVPRAVLLIEPIVRLDFK